MNVEFRYFCNLDPLNSILNIYLKKKYSRLSIVFFLRDVKMSSLKILLKSRRISFVIKSVMKGEKVMKWKSSEIKLGVNFRKSVLKWELKDFVCWVQNLARRVGSLKWTYLFFAKSLPSLAQVSSLRKQLISPTLTRSCQAEFEKYRQLFTLAILNFAGE